MGTAHSTPARRSSTVKGSVRIPSAPHAAGIAIRSPYAKRLATSSRPPRRPTIVDQPLVARVLAETPLEPAAAAQPRHLEVGLVRQRVGGDRHGDDDGELEEPAAGQQRGGEQHGLALERDSHEEQRIAVFEQERLHGAFRRSRAPGSGRPDPPPTPKPRPSTYFAWCAVTLLANCL